MTGKQGVGLPDDLQKVDASEHRHADIHEDEIDALSSQQRENIQGIILMKSLKTLGLKHFGKREAHLTFIVHDEDGKAHAAMIHTPCNRSKVRYPRGEDVAAGNV